MGKTISCSIEVSEQTYVKVTCQLVELLESKAVPFTFELPV